MKRTIVTFGHVEERIWFEEYTKEMIDEDLRKNTTRIMELKKNHSDVIDDYKILSHCDHDFWYIEEDHRSRENILPQDILEELTRIFRVKKWYAQSIWLSNIFEKQNLNIVKFFLPYLDHNQEDFFTRDIHSSWFIGVGCSESKGLEIFKVVMDSIGKLNPRETLILVIKRGTIDMLKHYIRKGYYQHFHCYNLYTPHHKTINNEIIKCFKNRKNFEKLQFLVDLEIVRKLNDYSREDREFVKKISHNFALITFLVKNNLLSHS